MVADAHIYNTDMGTLKSQKEVKEMDVPKITVFKSPPWHKPIQHAAPKISDIFEEFPTKTKLLSKRLSMSQSLECIPENMILQDIQKHTHAHHRESNRLSPHQVLPPIPKNGDEDMPEMRQRAYSDPHRYTTILKKKLEERRESPLTKQVTIQCSKDKEKNTLELKNHRRTNSRENKPSKLVGNIKTTGAAIPPGDQITGSYKRPQHAVHTSDSLNRVSPVKPPHPNPSLRRSRPNDSKIHHNLSNPSTPESRINKNKKLITKCLSDSSPTHPTVAALRESEPRIRTNSLPGAFTNKEGRKKSLSNRTVKPNDCVKKSIAYALIGSPGRNRWPSPDRNTSSYINSDDNDPTDSSLESSAENIGGLVTSHESERMSPIKIHTSSEEFKSVLKDLKDSKLKVNQAADY